MWTSWEQLALADPGGRPSPINPSRANSFISICVFARMHPYQRLGNGALLTIMISKVLGPHYYFSNMDLGGVIFVCCFSCGCCGLVALGNTCVGYTETIQGLTFYCSKYNYNTCFCVTSIKSLLQSPKLITS